MLANLRGTPWPMAALLYGSGLRLFECIRLRVKDMDFRANQIWVREAKGGKDRLTMLPQVLKNTWNSVSRGSGCSMSKTCWRDTVRPH